MKIGIVSLTALAASISLASPAKAENFQHTRQLLSTKQCLQCDLSGSGLVQVDLSGAQLSGANLSGANLSRANLSGANLSGANLSGASLYGVNLNGANLSGANLNGTDLRDAYLGNAIVTGTNFNAAYVLGAVGIPQSAGTPEDFYRWAVTEAQNGDYKGAIDHFNKALSLNPEFAPAYLARGVSRYRLGDEKGATIDAQASSQLFDTQKNPRGAEMAKNFLKGIEDARNARSRGNDDNIFNFLGGLGLAVMQLLF